MKNPNVQTFKHCYDECNNDADCYSFYWDHKDQRCNLKSAPAHDTAGTNNNSNAVCYSRTKKDVNTGGETEEKSDNTISADLSPSLTDTYEA